MYVTSILIIIRRRRILIIINTVVSYLYKYSASSNSNQEPAIRLSEDDRDHSIYVNPDGLLGQSRTETWAGVRADTGVVSGILPIFLFALSRICSYIELLS